MGAKPSIVLGQYVGAYVSNTALFNLAGMMQSLYETGQFNNYLWATSCRVDTNRNYLIHDFLHKTTGDYLFIFDEDMVHPPQMPSLLAERDKPIISGLYFKRSEDGTHAPQFYRYEGQDQETRRGHGTAVNDTYRQMIPELIEFFNNCGDLPAVNGPTVLVGPDGTRPQGGLMRIDGGGFGCLLLRRDALEAMDEPYLLSEPALNGDLVFYKQARLKGIEVWGDATVIASHLQSTPVGLHSFSEYAWRWLEDVQHAIPPQTMPAVNGPVSLL